MHVRTCKMVRDLCREIKSKIELKHSYIYDFGPWQCLAMPTSIDTKFGTLMEFNERNSMLHVIS